MDISTAATMNALNKLVENDSSEVELACDEWSQMLFLCIHLAKPVLTFTNMTVWAGEDDVDLTDSHVVPQALLFSKQASLHEETAPFQIVSLPIATKYYCLTERGELYLVTRTLYRNGKDRRITDCTKLDQHTLTGLLRTKSINALAPLHSLIGLRSLVHQATISFAAATPPYPAAVPYPAHPQMLPHLLDGWIRQTRIKDILDS